MRSQSQTAPSQLRGWAATSDLQVQVRCAGMMTNRTARRRRQHCQKTSCCVYGCCAGLAEAAGHAWHDLHVPHFGTWQQRVQLVQWSAGLVLAATLGE